MSLALPLLPDVGSVFTNKSSRSVPLSPLGFCDISLAHRILTVTHTFALRSLVEPLIPADRLTVLLHVY